MTIKLFLLAGLLSSQLCLAMTFEQRESISVSIDATITTLQNKYLPAQRMKSSLAQATGENLAILKTTYANWPKQYSKEIGYIHDGDAIVFTYRYAPVLKMQITSLKPYKVKFNDETEIQIDNEHGFKTVEEFLRKEQFGKASKHASLFLLPEAFAEDPAGTAQTFKNSVILAVDYSVSAASKTAAQLVKDGYLLPDERSMYAQYRSPLRPIKCDGETAEGKIKDADGSYLAFKATRTGGVEFTDSGVTFKAANEQNVPICGEVEGFSAADDDKGLGKMENSNTGRNAHQAYLDKAASGGRDNELLNCMDEEIKLAERYQMVDPRGPNYADAREREYYRARDAARSGGGRSGSFLPSPVVEHLRNKCIYKAQEYRRTDEYRAEREKRIADAEKKWLAESDYNVGAAFRQFTSAALGRCRQLSELKPDLKLNCVSPRTVGEAKKLCGAVAAASVRVGQKLQACFADKVCEPMESTWDRDLRMFRDKLDVKKAYHSALAKFRADNAAEFKSEALKEENGVIRIANPNALSGAKLQSISKELSDLSALALAQPKKVDRDYSRDTSKDKKSPSLASLVGGAMGLLDCCYDIECKKSLAESSIDMQPGASDPKTNK